MRPPLRCLFQIEKSVRAFSRFSSSSASKSNDKIIQSSIITQQGNAIQELPIVLRKAKDGFLRQSTLKAEVYNQLNVRTEDILLLIDDCRTVKNVLFVIDAFREHTHMPVEIAIHAVEKLLTIGGSVDFRNLEDTSDIFNNMLINNIQKNGGTTHLLEILSKIRKFDIDLPRTQMCLETELLLRNSDGLLSLIEVCEAIHLMSNQKLSERFWTGITDNEGTINENNIIFVFRILPRMKISRRLLTTILEKRIPEIWYNLKPNVVLESFRILKSIGLQSTPIYHSYARWVNTNGHIISERELQELIRLFREGEFFNSELDKALERYIKAKAIKITDLKLIDELLMYCSSLRYFNPHVLNGICEHFICKPEMYNENSVRNLVTVLGQFNFQPTNGIKFWMKFEKYTHLNFNKFDPEHLVAMFISCCYLEIFPLNFVSSIFNPHFLDQLYTAAGEEKLQKIRMNLKLLDAALTLGSDNYSGPLLPKDHSAKVIWVDGRIRRILHAIQKTMEYVAGGFDQFTKSVSIGKLPANGLYNIDFLIHPRGMTQFWGYSIKKDKDSYVAVLVLLPNYYDRTGEILCGEQKMRIRHIRKLGLRVVTLRYDVLNKLVLYPGQLEDYIKSRMKEALPALPFKQ